MARQIILDHSQKTVYVELQPYKATDKTTPRGYNASYVSFIPFARALRMCNHFRIAKHCRVKGLCIAEVIGKPGNEESNNV
eukprot:1162053-Amphidinium_carterae.1